MSHVLWCRKFWCWVFSATAIDTKGDGAGKTSLFSPSGSDGQVHPPDRFMWQELTCVCSGLSVRSSNRQSARNAMGRRNWNMLFGVVVDKLLDVEVVVAGFAQAGRLPGPGSVAGWLAGAAVVVEVPCYSCLCGRSSTVDLTA